MLRALTSINDLRARQVFLCAFGGTLLLMGTAMFLGTIGIDDESLMIYPTFDGVGRGLWGLTAITYLVPGQLGISFAPMVLGCAIYAASITLLVRAWGIDDSRVECAAAGVIACFPYFASMMSFDVAHIAYPISLLLVTVSAVSAFHPRVGWGIVYGSVTFALAFACYQGAAATFGTALISIFLMRTVMAADAAGQVRWALRRQLPAATTIAICGGILYLVTDRLAKALIPHTEWSAHYSVRVDLLFLNLERLPAVLRQAQVLLSGGTGDLPWLSATTFFAAVIAALAHICLRQGLLFSARLWACTCLLIGSLVAPFSILIVQAHPLAPRSTVGLGVMYGVVIALLACKAPRWLRAVAMSIATIWCFQFVMIGNEMYYCQHLATIADMTTTSRVVARIDSIAAAHQLPTPVQATVIGRFAPADRRYARFSTLGSSAFDWDQGNIYRQRALLRIMGVDGISFIADPQLRARVAEHVSEQRIPAWPAPGSVFLFDNRIVAVNLGSPT
jgi:hypothetical protein